ncbi:MAG TPA: hypothetical protein VFH39_02870 [Candidatus Saccharimonadales bacterium]|nr:hypothetical protein [Candidatus Saccharimonadales bacterium]
MVGGTTGDESAGVAGVVSGVVDAEEITTVLGLETSVDVGECGELYGVVTLGKSGLELYVGT